MKKLFSILSFFLFVTAGFSQLRIDSSFPFQTDPAKKYSLYIPSNYSPSVPHRLMLAFHPYNTSRWDGKSWCDTLKVFAETNGLILVSPDGGVDGKIDDPIDTAFTSALLDSMNVWYNINPMKIYVMGFSWGGKTTYTYGLYHSKRFGGFLPIGAAINGTTEVTGLLQNSTSKPIYIVHGSLDSPTIRFYPIRDSLINRNAIVNYTFMPGVAHTIDFPNRNQILSVAYKWIDSVNCANIASGININSAFNSQIQLYPLPLHKGESLNVNYISPSKTNVRYFIYASNGKEMTSGTIIANEGKTPISLPTNKFSVGVYIIRFSEQSGETSKKITITD
ncbi:MAG: T9SS type A sorting domain-containing protein [Bacteroidia bacterium]